MALRNRSTAGPPTSTSISTAIGVPGPPGPPGVSGFVAAGDLDGSATSQNVRKIQNVPVKSGTPTDGQVLTYVSADGKWEAQDVAGQASIKPLGLNSTWAGTYYVAPVTGNDANNGTSSGTPIKTFRQLTKIFSTISPHLIASLTLVLLEPQADTSDRLYLTPLMSEGGKLYLTGTLTSIATGTFTTVTPKSTSGADGRWRANLGSGATGHLTTRGLKLVNTTRGNSVALIHEVISGTTVALTQPYEASTVASPNLPSHAPAEHSDWVAGDSWTLYQMPALDLGQLQPVTVESNSSADFGFCIVNNIYIPDPAVPGIFGFTNCVLGKGVVLIESQIDAFAVYPLTDTFGFPQAINTIYSGGGVFHGCELVGGSVGSDSATAILDNCQIDGDIIITDTATLQNGSELGAVCARDAVLGIVGGCAAISVLSGTPILYGTYTFAVGGNPTSFYRGLGSFLYDTTAVNFFHGVPTLELDAESVGIAEDTSVTPSPRYPNVGLTAAHIDASVASGGFGAIAHGYNGSFIGPQSFSPGSPTAFVLPAANGGTGVASPTAHGVLVAEGASPATAVVLGSGQILVGQSSADPQAKTVSGDLAISAAGAATLPNTGVSAGTYGDATNVPQVTVDAKGRVTNVTTAAVATGLPANAFLNGGNVSVPGNSTVTNLGSVTFTWPNGSHVWVVFTYYVTNPDSSPDDILLGGSLNSAGSFNLGSPTFTIPGNAGPLETGHGGITHQHRVVATGISQTIYALAQSNTVGMTVSCRIMAINVA